MQINLNKEEKNRYIYVAQVLSNLKFYEINIE